MSGPGLPSGDLLELTRQLVEIPSVSFAESELCDIVEAELAGVGWLTVDRIGDNLVARTQLGRDRRLLLAGHLDTVPGDGVAEPSVEGDTLWGLGAADMKGGLAVMLELARTIAEPAVDVTYVFYAREEVAHAHSGLGELFEQAAPLLAADAAILGEPTSAAVEAGCQGTLRLRVTLAGARAHTARGWMGVNAIHRLGEMLVALDSYPERQPVIDGCEYHEALHAVGVSGGISGNVVPDRVELLVNHRFAPDRSLAEAEAHVRETLSPWLGPDDEVVLEDVAGGAMPGMENPLLAAVLARSEGVTAKLGWTDVARFAAAGIPAANLGPGDPTYAHAPDEHVSRADLERVHAILADVVTSGA